MKFWAEGLFSTAMAFTTSIGPSLRLKASRKWRNTAPNKLMPEQRLPMQMTRSVRERSKSCAVLSMDFWAASGRAGRTEPSQWLHGPMLNGLIAV